MNSLEGKHYKIITFGCQMNEHDSETMAGLLQEAGALPCEDAMEADIVIINTCSVRENADKRFFGTLGQMKKIKAINPGFTACVCGCMMQQEPVVRDVRQKYPWVDVIFGTHNIDQLTEMLEELYEKRSRQEKKKKTETDDQGIPEETENEAAGPLTKRDYTRAKHEIRSSRDSRVIRIEEDRESIVEGLPASRLFRHKAFVNIMYGCNNFCSYCIVPYTRGREKSRAPEDILREVRKLVEDGVSEVTLLGQNVNSYRGKSSDDGIGHHGTQWDFTDLIYALNEIEGLERIRFMTSHPKDLSDRLIEAFERCDKLCPYIHLPLQAGSSAVLRRMNRKYTREEYLDRIHKLRQRIPGIAISTDIIVGFPGESEEDFEETLALVRQVRYDSAFTFLYSPRPGTPAADYEDQIPEEVKHRRFDRLVEIMNEISREKNEAYTGKVCPVLVDGPAKRGEKDTEADRDGQVMLSGRTEEFKLVDFKGTPDLAGRIVPVRIIGAKTFSLQGELESQMEVSDEHQADR